MSNNKVVPIEKKIAGSIEYIAFQNGNNYVVVKKDSTSANDIIFYYKKYSDYASFSSAFATPGSITYSSSIDVSISEIDIQSLLSSSSSSSSSSVTIVDGGSVSLGAKADSSATSDNGSFSLISLFKRLLEKISSGINSGGFSEKLSIAVTTSTTAYSANDNIGGIQTLTNFLRTSGGTGIVNGISLWALANQKPNLYIDFWDISPSGTYTNDIAQVISGDQASWLGHVEIGAGDWKDTGTISRVSKTGLGVIVKGNASRNIYMTIQDKTGVTFGSAAGLFYKIGMLQD